ncbi:MAG: hypothetical protein E7620_07010, partial [Ruminococcaceae bacterium]|nr:hypothetical protein [Oscillospiraceae bacterium]
MKKLVSLFCILTLLLSTFAMMVSAAEEPTVSKWDGVIPEANKDYAFEGEGTEEKPWLIKSAAELAILAANARLNDKETTYGGKYFKLTVDIDMDNKEW